MADYALHRINSVVFDFDYPDDAAAFRARQEFREMLEERIVPALDRALDATGIQNKITTIPRIEIDLGVVDLDRLDAEQWTGAIIHAVHRRIADVPPIRGDRDVSVDDDLEETL
ncbi:MAG: contractile injection system tape measure protein, partial [Rhodothermia bacterium]